MTHKTEDPSFQTDRRTFLGAATALGAAVVANPIAAAGTAQAQTTPRGRSATPGATVTTREILSSKEAIPALGLGTFLVFDAIPGAKRDNLREVMKTYFEAGAGG